MIVGVLTTCHTRSPDATPCDFLLWGYVKDQICVPSLPASIPELKVVTCYKQVGTNSIIVLMSVNHKGCTYRAPIRYVTKTSSVVLLNKKVCTPLSEVYFV